MKRISNTALFVALAVAVSAGSAWAADDGLSTSAATGNPPMAALPPPPQDGNMPQQGQDGPPPPPADGSTASGTTTPPPQGVPDLAARQKLVEYARSKGVDVSAFTDDVVADPAKFHDAWETLMQTLRKQGMRRPEASGSGSFQRGGMRRPLMDGSGSFDRTASGGLNMRGHGRFGRPGTGSGTFQPGMGPDASGSGSLQSGTTPPPKKPSALSAKARQKFIDQLDAIPADQRAAMYAQISANIDTQIGIAQSKKQRLLVRKLQEMQTVLDDTLGSASDSGDDDTVVDTVINGK